MNRCSPWSRGHIQRLDPPCTSNLAHIRRQGHVQSHVVSQLFPSCCSSVRRRYIVLPLIMTSVNAPRRFWIFYRAYHDGEAFLVCTDPGTPQLCAYGLHHTVVANRLLCCCSLAMHSILSMSYMRRVTMRLQKGIRDQQLIELSSLFTNTNSL